MQLQFFSHSAIPAFLISLFVISSSFCQNSSPDSKLRTDVLIVGGGASGVSAALQAARDGVDVILVEPTPWLGGMPTSAGVSAVDGNHNLPSGIWGEFRNRLREYYGGAEALATGWVSHTQFEPHVGNRIFNEMLDGLTMLTMNELADPYEAGTDLYKTAIGVGDYPLDHHRKLNPSPADSLLADGDRHPYEFETHYDAFPPIPSFSVPFGSLIPKKVDGLMVTEKVFLQVL